MLDEINSYRKKLEKNLSPTRYEHSLSVSYTCISLAMRYDYDLDKAEVFGLMHDCAKMYKDDELVSLCHKNNIELTKDALKAPAVIHAAYGAWLVQEKYGIHDPEIIEAIKWHTTGRPDMSLPEKILYVADYIEPRRYKADNLGEVRAMAYKNLDLTLYTILESSLDYLSENNMYIDSMTKSAYDYYKKLILK